MNDFLDSSEYIDWESPSVKAKALELSFGLSSDEAVARVCFEFVRDEIKHSVDYQMNVVTLRASEVLEQGTGFCYAKSHLLAALLRANGIPAALCYQRLTVSDGAPPYCLHGINAVRLKQHGWVRIDARGNNENVDAGFRPPMERLAFEIRTEGERDIEGLYAVPIESLVRVLSEYSCVESVLANLPDALPHDFGDR